MGMRQLETRRTKCLVSRSGRASEENGGGLDERRVVGPELGALVDAGGEQQTDRDGKLVQTDDHAAQGLGRALGLVHGHEARDDADAEAGEHSANLRGGARRVASVSRTTVVRGPGRAGRYAR